MRQFEIKISLQALKTLMEICLGFVFLWIVLMGISKVMDLSTTLMLFSLWPAMLLIMIAGLIGTFGYINGIENFLDNHNNILLKESEERNAATYQLLYYFKTSIASEKFNRDMIRTIKEEGPTEKCFLKLMTILSERYEFMSTINLEDYDKDKVSDAQMGEAMRESQKFLDEHLR